MKKFFTNLRKIKWENIALIIAIAFSINAMLHHISINGLMNTKLEWELPVYSMGCIGVWYFVRDLRKNPKHWLFED